MKIDYLIVGQGLAGSLLAWELIQRKKKVVIIDNAKENASLVAAGLINPVTGKRLVKTAYVDELLPVAINYYHALSKFFQQRFYIEKPLYRVLNNTDQKQLCQNRLSQSEYQNYLTKIIPEAKFIRTSLGILIQKQTGYLLTKPLLQTLKFFFICTNVYLKAEINYAEISLEPVLRWKNLEPTQIIFCEGYAAKNNPWFCWLPFQPVKGEIITATTAIKLPTYIINYGHWFIPLNDNQFRIGATFDRENLDNTTTVEGKHILLNFLRQVCPEICISDKYTQQAGIRPTTLDKQPFVGKHPIYPELAIFNGFGAKGSLQIPWYCLCFADHLLNNQAIPAQSNINRFNII